MCDTHMLMMLSGYSGSNDNLMCGIFRLVFRKHVGIHYPGGLHLELDLSRQIEREVEPVLKCTNVPPQSA